jgi:hypothetical protein
MRSVDHFLLTRFFVRIKRDQPLPPEAWLRERLAYFEGVCLPSVAAQNSTDFRWLLFVDDGAPEWVKTYLNDRIPHNAEVVLVGDVCDGAAVSREVAARALSKWTITSRVDSDDALDARYIAMVRRRLEGRENVFLNFTDGYQLSRGRLLKYSHPSNAFISLIESRHEAPMTVFVDWHDRVSRHAPIIQDRSIRAWVQNCHGSNVRNQERGIRANLPVIHPRYPFLELKEQHTPEYTFDVAFTASRAALAVIAKPRRVLRIFGRV